MNRHLTIPLLTLLLLAITCNPSLSNDNANPLSLTDREQFDYFYDMAKLSAKDDLDIALVHLKKALDLAFLLEDYELIGKANWRAGSYYERQGKIKNAVPYYHSAFRAYLEIGNTRYCNMLLENLGTLSLNNSAFQIAYNLYSKRLEFVPELSKSEIADIHLDLALSLKSMNEIEQSLDHLLKAKKVLFNYELTDTLLRADIEFELGLVHKLIGQQLSMNNYLDSARKYYSKSIKINRSPYMLSKVFNNIGNTYLTQSAYDSASVYYHKSLLLTNKIGNKRLQALNLINLGVANYYSKNYDEAHSYLIHSIKTQLENIDIFKEHEAKELIFINIPEYLGKSYQYLDSLQLKDSNKYTYPTKELLSRYNDVLTNKKLIEATTQIEVLKSFYAILEKEEIAKQEAEEQALILYLKFGAGFILFLILFLIIRQEKILRSSKNLDGKISELRSKAEQRIKDLTKQEQ